MKYLKKFNEDIIVPNIYYQYISPLFSIRSLDIIDFNIKYRDIIKSRLIGSYSITLDSKYLSIEKITKFGGFKIKICECPDEWFFIQTESPYSSTPDICKCDQFDGVLRYLEDRGIIGVAKVSKIEESEKWEVISDDDFWNAELNLKLVTFTTEEWNKIESILLPLFNHGDYSMEWAKNATTKNTIIDIIEFNEDRVFEIWKEDDEWFYIVNWTKDENDGRYTKCDQWDGFEECLTIYVSELI
jgi:hypothetical protein